jgi:hypothetical protein
MALRAIRKRTQPLTLAAGVAWIRRLRAHRCQIPPLLTPNFTTPMRVLQISQNMLRGLSAGAEIRGAGV